MNYKLEEAKQKNIIRKGLYLTFDTDMTGSEFESKVEYNGQKIIPGYPIWKVATDADGNLYAMSNPTNIFGLRVMEWMKYRSILDIIAKLLYPIKDVEIQALNLDMYNLNKDILTEPVYKIWLTDSDGKLLFALKKGYSINILPPVGGVENKAHLIVVFRIPDSVTVEFDNQWQNGASSLTPLKIAF